LKVSFLPLLLLGTYISTQLSHNIFYVRFVCCRCWEKKKKRKE
jgi:hypothetical protein